MACRTTRSGVKQRSVSHLFDCLHVVHGRFGRHTRRKASSKGRDLPISSAIKSQSTNSKSSIFEGKDNLCSHEAFATLHKSLSQLSFLRSRKA